MARLIPADNFCFLSNTTSSQSFVSCNPTSFNRHRFDLFPSKQCLRLRVLCGIKEKENVREAGKFDGVLTGLRVDELEGASSVSESEDELGRSSGSGEVGFDWNWPPWKDIPQRYKLIGTTALAFVICNMDKVVLCSLILRYFYKHVIWYLCIVKFTNIY